MIAEIVIAATMFMSGVQADMAQAELQEWESIGECRVSTFCPVCNDGAGHESSSGAYLTTGHAACNFLPIGTKVNVEGEEYEIVDICGIDNTIDIFVDDDSGVCHCNRLEYKNVSVKK